MEHGAEAPNSWHLHGNQKHKERNYIVPKFPYSTVTVDKGTKAKD